MPDPMLAESAPVPQAEAPAVFKHGPTSYWIMSSHLTGWAANAPLLWHADSSEGLCGATWQLMPQPASGETHSNFVYSSTLSIAAMEPDLPSSSSSNGQATSPGSITARADLFD